MLCLTAVCLAMLFLNITTYQALHSLKPLVIRISDVGRAEAITYDSLPYQPPEAEIRYFPMDFVQRHYSRVHATVRENYARSLYYLDGRFADATIEENKKNKTNEAFLASRGDEVEVNVNNVAIEDLRTVPYKATVDLRRCTIPKPTTCRPSASATSAILSLSSRDHVSNALIPVNPLGLTITYFREDQAFE